MARDVTNQQYAGKQQPEVIENNSMLNVTQIRRDGKTPTKALFRFNTGEVEPNRMLSLCTEALLVDDELAERFIKLPENRNLQAPEKRGATQSDLQEAVNRQTTLDHK